MLIFIKKQNNKNGNFIGIYYFSSVNTKKFANFLEILAKFSISQNWKKKIVVKFCRVKFKRGGTVGKVTLDGERKGQRAEE